MAVTKATPKLDLEKGSVLLMSGSLTNAFKGSFHPDNHWLQIEVPGASDSAGRLNYIADTEGAELTEQGNNYLYRVQIAPGKYSFVAITGIARRFPIMGSFQIPMIMGLDVPPASVVYLGRVVARTRERGEGDFRAGPVIPLVDQSVAGFSRSTWDVEIRDEEAADIERFRREFPAMRDVPILKRLLPAWDRKQAFEWWEKN